MPTFESIGCESNRNKLLTIVQCEYVCVCVCVCVCLYVCANWFGSMQSSQVKSENASESDSVSVVGESQSTPTVTRSTVKSDLVSSRPNRSKSIG